MKKLLVLALVLMLSGVCFAEEYKKISDTQLEISNVILPAAVVTMDNLLQMQKQAGDNLAKLDVQYAEAKARLQAEKTLIDTRVTEARKLGIKTQAELQPETP